MYAAVYFFSYRLNFHIHCKAIILVRFDAEVFKKYNFKLQKITNGNTVKYITGHTVFSTLQDTLFSVHYKTLCFQYTTGHTVFSTLQDTLFSVHYRTLCFQYTTGHSVFSTLQDTLFSALFPQAWVCLLGVHFHLFRYLYFRGPEERILQLHFPV